MNPQPRLVSIGEVLWDLLPGGPQLGGAPGNVACHFAALGGRAALVSRVGRDDLGKQALQALAARSVDVEAVGVDPEAPTGTVGVEVTADGHPRFTIHGNVAWDRIEAGPAARHRVAEADALCFGTLAQRSAVSRNAIRELIGCARPGATILLDINFRPPTPDATLVDQSLALANALKLNETELPTVAEMLGIGGTAAEVMEALAKRFGLQLVILTLGPEGSRILHGREWTVQPGRKAEPLVDTVGAGDAFTATLLLGLARGLRTADAARVATEIAAFVCTQPGATPMIPDRLRALLG